MSGKMKTAQNKKENPFLNILINIFLPVAILNQAEKIDHPDSAVYALLLALALPIGYGLWDYVKNHRKNYVALLGVINVAFTGGFAFLRLSGLSFALKEAFFPLILGLGVLASQYFNKPFFVTAMKNSGAFRWALIEQKAQENRSLPQFHILLRNSNLLFASSFFISSLLNFVLALSVFKPLAGTLSEIEKQQVLNQQIAEMTWKGWAIIALPLMVFMALIFWYFIHGVKKITGLQFEDFAGESETKVSS